ncbi:RNA binding protein [Actinidia rufa]|uniref:RNA binding protein n=1 Tax=Actinidia rufa TaxID=165716 RepID=A0A7J0FQK6_9ERIC|nr:RNA binding protein [Actinidia rufa]
MEKKVFFAARHGCRYLLDFFSLFGRGFRVCFNGYSGFQSRQNPNPSVPISQTHLQLHFPIKTHKYLTQLPPKSRPFRYNSASETSVSAPIEAEAVDDEDDPIANLSFLDLEMDPESISEWELDFYSRPILNVKGKKVWELLVCDRTLSLQFTKYFPNNVINSITLKEAIVSISDELGVPLPDKVRFSGEFICVFVGFVQ